MSLLSFVKKVIPFRRRADGILADFKEMILIIQPHQTATLYTDPGSRMVVTGFSGTVWITVLGNPIRYTIKHGETLRIPGYGKIIMHSISQNVPGKLHVCYSPGQASVH